MPCSGSVLESIVHSCHLQTLLGELVLAKGLTKHTWSEDAHRWCVWEAPMLCLQSTLVYGRGACCSTW